MQSEDDFRRFIEERQWTFAKTMPQWPHEYTVRRFEDPKSKQDVFEEAVAFLRANGECRVFEPTGRSSVYFDIDGRQYWTMGAPIEETVIINRAWLDWRERLARGRGQKGTLKRAAISGRAKAGSLIKV
jgi:hypothetical protein